MDIEKRYVHFLLKISSVIIIVLLVYIFFTTIFKWFLPFIIAYGIAYITNPFVDLLETKLRIPRKIASLATILLALSFLVTIVSIIIYRGIFEIKKLSDMLPNIIESISNLFYDLLDKGINVYDNLPMELAHIVNSLINGFLNSITSILANLTEYTTKFAYNIAKSLPSIFIFIIVLFISTYFISSDKKKISKYVFEKIPKEALSRIIIVKNDLILALLGYVKAQLILMGVTFIEISIGMLIIGVGYPVILALFISIIDALPVFGTGIILIPWALFNLLSGNFALALYLVILYLIILLVRQLLEPRIVGKQIGLYPLVTLMSMYIGFKALGMIGLIIGPITVLIIRSLIKSNTFTLWKE